MKRCVWAVLFVLLISAAAISFADTEVPVFSQMYTGVDLKLGLLSSDSDRVFAFAGPGKAYYNDWGYKPHQQKKVTAYFIENGWIYTDIIYATAEERCLYFPKGVYEWSRERDSLPDASGMPSYTGKVIGDALPAWGPGRQYNRVRLFVPKSGTPVRVFFQENGFAYAEYACDAGLIRMWLPCDNLEMDDAKLTITDETKPPYTVSNYRTGESIYVDKDEASDQQTGGEEIAPPAPGEWSAWSDTPISEAPGIEVRTRTLYRRKIEIQDWTEWIDGDPPYDHYDTVETRTVTNADGGVVLQWREYGYHYHYGDWTEWSENELANATSSSDIVQSKTQYSYRTIP